MLPKETGSASWAGMSSSEQRKLIQVLKPNFQKNVYIWKQYSNFGSQTVCNAPIIGYKMQFRPWSFNGEVSHVWVSNFPSSISGTYLYFVITQQFSLQLSFSYLKTSKFKFVVASVYPLGRRQKIVNLNPHVAVGTTLLNRHIASMHWHFYGLLYHIRSWYKDECP